MRSLWYIEVSTHAVEIIDSAPSQDSTIDSAPARSLLFLSLTLSLLCMYFCNAPSNWFFFFVSWLNWAISWPSVLHDKNYKTLFFEFCFVAMATKIFAKSSNCFFFFVFRWNRAVFCPLVFRESLYKTLFFDYWFSPLTPKIDSPKFGQKSPITWLAWQIDHRCLHLIGGFRGWPIEWNHTKCCRADLCYHGIQAEL